MGITFMTGEAVEGCKAQNAGVDGVRAILPTGVHVGCLVCPGSVSEQRLAVDDGDLGTPPADVCRQITGGRDAGGLVN